VYMVNTSLIPKDNARGQLQLANFARDAGLYYQAARAYDYAEKADPSLKAEIERERGIGRKLAAEFCLKKAQEALAQNKVKDAEHYLSLLVQKLSDQPQAEQAAQLLEQHYMKEHQARSSEIERQNAELFEKDLKKGKELYERMLQRTRDGLTARNENKAESLWEGAVEDGHDVLKEIERLEKKYPDEPRVLEGADSYRRLTVDQIVEAHLHLASQYTVHSSYKKALEETNSALSLDPKSQQALAQRARIEAASSEGLGLDLF
jgi:hypothetical protein